MRLRERPCHLAELLARLLRVRREQSKRCFGVDAIPLHEDALRLLDDRARPERTYVP